MNDTPIAMEIRYRQMLMQRSSAERLKMGCSMLATARALIVASVRKRHADMGACLPSRHGAVLHAKHKAPYERRLRGIRPDLELERMRVHSGISRII